METENQITEETVIPTVGNLGKKVFIQELNNKIDDIQSISTIYNKIDKDTRYKITVIVSREEHYEDI